MAQRFLGSILALMALVSASNALALDGQLVIVQNSKANISVRLTANDNIAQTDLVLCKITGGLERNDGIIEQLAIGSESYMKGQILGISAIVPNQVYAIRILMGGEALKPGRYSLRITLKKENGSVGAVKELIVIKKEDGSARKGVYYDVEAPRT
jgi:hypothetical protein